MAITIDIMAGDFEQGSNMKATSKHISFINNLFGIVFTSKIISEEGEEDTWSNVYLYSPKLSMEDVSCWDELGEYANKNEVYVNIYDHGSKARKGYWFDEDQEWQDMDDNSGEEYEENKPK